MDVDGDSRNKMDLEINCDSKEHYLWRTAIAMPALLVWGLGAPFFALTLLNKFRKKLETI